MSIMPAIRLSAEQLLHLGDRAGRCELVRGELRSMSPANPRHAQIVTRIARLFDCHTDLRGGGTTMSGDPGFLVGRDPDTVLAPDVAFVRDERQPIPDRGWYPGPPDLAIEVRSPNDSARSCADKACCWLQYGCKVVLDVDPATATITVWRADADRQELRGDHAFTDPMLPGFRLLPREVFARRQAVSH